MASLSWDSPPADVRRLLARRQVQEFHDRARVEAISPQDALDWDPLVDSRVWVMELYDALPPLLAGRFRPRGKTPEDKLERQFFNRLTYRAETMMLTACKVCRMELEEPEVGPEPWTEGQAREWVAGVVRQSTEMRWAYADLLLAWAWAHRPNDGLSDQVLREGLKMLNLYDVTIRTLL